MTIHQELRLGILALEKAQKAQALAVLGEDASRRIRERMAALGTRSQHGAGVVTITWGEAPPDAGHAARVQRLEAQALAKRRRALRKKEKAT